MTLGAILRERRKSIGISREEMELLTGVSAPTIARFERGHDGASVGNVIRLFEALGGQLEVRFGDLDGCSRDTCTLGPMVALPGGADAEACADWPGAETDRPGEAWVPDPAKREA